MKQVHYSDAEMRRAAMMPCLWCDESEDDDDIFMPSSKGKSAASSKGKSAASSKGKSAAPPSIYSDDDFMPRSKGKSAASSKGKSDVPSKGKSGTPSKGKTTSSTFK
jgi:hypothetical protein